MVVKFAFLIIHISKELMQVNNKDLTPIISNFWKYYDILEREERMLKIRDSQEGNFAVKCLKAYPFCPKKVAGKV